MGIDLYVMTDSEEHSDDITACCRNLASEQKLPELLKGKGCNLFNFVIYGEALAESGEEPPTFDAAEVLAEVDKACTVCEGLAEDAFEFGKAPALEDLKEVREAVSKAKDLGCKVYLDIG